MGDFAHANGQRDFLNAWANSCSIRRELHARSRRICPPYMLEYKTRDMTVGGEVWLWFLDATAL